MFRSLVLCELVPMKWRIGFLGAAVFTAASLPSCSTSSGVVPIGQDTYLISRSHKSTRGSGTWVKGEALQEANEYCEKRGKVMKLVKTVERDMKPFRADASAEVYFKALSPSDPELKKPLKVEEIRE